MTQWEGKSKGSVLGYKIFVFILNRLGLKPAYLLLRLVAFYYFVFARKSTRAIFYFYNTILKYKTIASLYNVYKNYYVFGQTILDKVALLAGAKTNFTVNHEGGEILDQIAATGKGGILISAHIGNWEIAGQLLNRLNTTFNILMYENEHETIKRYMDGVQKNKNVNIIAIKEGEMNHLIELHHAFTNNELVVMHGDRFRDGTKTMEAIFLGKKAQFPAGPFIMAAKFGVPVTFVFAIKESNTHYHFFASPPVQLKRTRTETHSSEAMKELLQQYIAALEKTVKRYPEQWFNYYDFWKD